MEEKILVQSQLYNIKKPCVWIFVLILLIGTISWCAYEQVDFDYSEDLAGIAKYEPLAEAGGSARFPNFPEKLSGEEAQRRLNSYRDSLSAKKTRNAGIIFAGLFFSAVAGGLLVGGLYLWLNTEMVVTDKRVYGKTAFGKRVDLPLDSISAVGSSLMKGITISTSSGRISFLPIKNRDDIHKRVSDLLIERQKKRTENASAQSVVQQSAADELKKYKDLLDSGIISQEEFDAKKKQLLGL